MEKYGKEAVVQVSTVFLARLQSCFSKGLSKLDLLDIYLTTFSEFVIWEMQNYEGHLFFLEKFQI